MGRRQKSKMQRQSSKQAVLRKQKSQEAAVVESAAAAAAAAAGAGGGAGAGASDGESVGDSIDAVEVAEHSLDDMLEMLSEKRATSRETGFKWMIKFMQHSVDDETLVTSLNSITSAAVSGLRKGRQREALLAAQAVALIGLHRGPDEETTASSLISSLRLMMVKKAAGAPAHAAGILAVALVCFICSTEETTAAESLALCEKLFLAPKTRTPVRVQALRAWALLASVLRVSQLRECVLRVLPAFAGHLHHPDLEVRKAAGACVALLYETRGGRRAVSIEAVELAAARKEEDDAELDVIDEGDEDDDDSDTDHDEDAVADKKKEWDWRSELGDEWAEDAEAEGAARTAYLMSKLHESLLETLTNLSRDNSKHKSKKNLRAQRLAFREIRNCVEAGTAPPTSVRIRTSVAEVTGWAARIQLGVLRDVLGTGLQTQLEFNETIRSILGIRGAVARGKSSMSKVEKRAFLSPNSGASKARTASRDSGRSAKQASNASFLAED